MNTRSITSFLSILHLAGISTLLVLAFACWNFYQKDPELIPLGNSLVVIVLYVTFLLAYLGSSCGIAKANLLADVPAFRRYVAFVQYASYLSLLILYHHPVLFFLPIITSISLAMSLKESWSRILTVVILNTLAGFIVVFLWDDPMLVIHSTGAIALQLVFLLFYHSVIQHYEIHLNLQDKIRNLETTRELLSKVSAQNERLRVSRNLHDVIGHQLTGLQLNLEIAEHVSSGKALKHLSKAKAVSKELLSNIRETVSSLRADKDIDLEQSLQLLVKKISHPVINIEVDLQTELSSKQAEVLLRCSQETVTNIIRHSMADKASIQLHENNEGIHLIISDNGKGMTNNVAHGTGLKGMKERVSELGGQFTIKSKPKAGTTIQITLL